MLMPAYVLALIQYTMRGLVHVCAYVYECVYTRMHAALLVDMCGCRRGAYAPVFILVLRFIPVWQLCF